MFFQRLSLVVLLVLTTVACHSAASAAGSEPKLSLLPPIAAVAVEPAVAPPGTPRKIIVAGIWPNSCIPTGAKLGFPQSWARTQGVGILLSEPLPFVACFSALTPYRFELEHTPTVAGQIDILVMTSEASPLATGHLVTGSAEAPKALYDMTGAWFDPQSAGSGFMVAHDFGKSDDIFATWHAYDPTTGETRWYWVQQGKWEENGMAWRGVMFESKADPSSCAPPCALPLTQVIYKGAVRLVFSVSITHGGLDASMDFIPTDGPVRRIANLQRFLPRTIVIQ